MTKRRTRLTMGEQLARLEQLMQPLFEGKSDEEQEALAEELVEEFCNTLDVISQATGGVPTRRPERRDR